MLPNLCSLEERFARLRAAGADRVVLLPFGRALAEAPAASFAQILIDDLGVEVVCVGEDFAFGRNREGTPEYLRAIGLSVHIHRFVLDGSGAKISSRRLRKDVLGGGSQHASNRQTPGRY